MLHGCTVFWCVFDVFVTIRSKSVMLESLQSSARRCSEAANFQGWDCCVRMCQDVRRDCLDCPPANVAKPDSYTFYTHFVLSFLSSENAQNSSSSQEKVTQRKATSAPKESKDSSNANQDEGRRAGRRRRAG